MIFRGRLPDATVWRRFRSGLDRFAFSRGTDGIYEAHVVANAERVVDLFYTLTEHLPPAVSVSLDDRRSGRSWEGDDVALPDLRDAVARLKVPLAAYGGIELSAYTSDDQLTLTPDLGLYVFARSDRWLYLLQGKGLEESPSLTEQQWRAQPWNPAPVPTLRDAVEAATQRMSLRPV
jgi:hypothetical protein